MTPFSIAAVGDVALLHRPGSDLFRTGWDDADLRIANLEAPLCDGGVPAAKLIRLQSPVVAAEWLRDDLRCNVVSLANNHIMDWGQPGLDSTLAALDQAAIAYAGAGATDAIAGAHRLLQVNGSTVAFLSWACTVPMGFRANAQQPGLAAIRVRTSYAADPFLIDEQPGTPPWVHTETWTEDVAALEQALNAARAAADFVILALHWGVPPQWQSNFQGPLAEYQDALAPILVAAGADLVLGHHAHTVYGVQAFSRPSSSPGLVCYSLGNYIFHPLASPRPLPLDAPSRPYRAPERPENRDSFVGVFTIDRGADGRLAVCEARLNTSLLDETWEAKSASPEAALGMAQRLHAFSGWRETPTRVDQGALVWRP
jgi:poly-gamma-glutamate capsule biosynthesis protein CapA/YwtB (metallophosphatase superfamily)